MDQTKVATAQYLMRKRIATEILTTERSYVKSMQTVMVRKILLIIIIIINIVFLFACAYNLLQGLLEHIKLETKSLNDIEFYTVFANLPEV